MTLLRHRWSTIVFLSVLWVGLSGGGEIPVVLAAGDEAPVTDDEASRTSDDPPAPVPAPPKPPKDKFEIKLLDRKAKITYSRKGLLIESPAGNYRMNIRWRSQIRFSYPFDKPPLTASQYNSPDITDFGWNRARLTVGGNAILPEIEYYLEHDLINNQLLELYGHVGECEWLQVRFGQWKAEYGRSRAMSSGKLQFVDRSILSPFTTVERQPGVQVRGHIKPGTRGDSWYYLGVFGGNGPGQGFFDGDGHPMYLARYEWNFLGRDLPLSASDIEYHEQPAATVAVAGSTNRSRYTAFSSQGGSQIPGFEAGAAGQYALKQAVAEFALKYRGLSVQNENHWKEAHDRLNAKRINLRGSYAQVGYFPHGLFKRVPKRLEAGYRYAYLDLDSSRAGDLQQEHSLVVNYFFEGHDNKLTFDVSRIATAQIAGPPQRAFRYRFQWDVHF